MRTHDEDEELPWNEEQWEEFMKRSDVRSARFGELFETLIDHPDRDEIIDKEMTFDERIRGVLSKLKADGLLIAVCSNSIRETTKMMLIRKGFMEYTEFLLSNQDVKNPKPNPEGYLRAMMMLGIGRRI